MARKKLNLAWIANESRRRATFKKRRKGLMKKVSELATLCDVKACAIVYGPPHEPQPEVWPSVPDATRVLSWFMSMPEMEQCKKMMDQEGFLRQRLTKLHDQLRKQERENQELQTSILMREALAGRRTLHKLGIGDTASLAWMVEMRVDEVQKRIELVKAKRPRATHEAVEGAAMELYRPTATTSREKNPTEVAMESLERQDWFMEVTRPDVDVAFGGEEILRSYNTDLDGSAWLDAFFFP